MQLATRWVLQCDPDVIKFAAVGQRTSPISLVQGPRSPGSLIKVRKEPAAARQSLGGQREREERSRA